MFKSKKEVPCPNLSKYLLVGTYCNKGFDKAAITKAIKAFGFSSKRARKLSEDCINGSVYLIITKVDWRRMQLLNEEGKGPLRPGYSQDFYDFDEVATRIVDDRAHAPDKLKKACDKYVKWKETQRKEAPIPEEYEDEDFYDDDDDD